MAAGGNARFNLAQREAQRKKKRTSIGHSKNTRPKNKRANKKRYRGQGK